MELKAVVPPKSEKTLEGGLARFLADTYALYLRTQNFHWNVTGRRFAELHAFFEREYTELALAVDGVAERLRALAGAGRRLVGEAEEAKDAVTADFATARLAAHEKEAWMLRSLLE